MEIISTLDRGDLVKLYFSQMMDKPALKIPLVALIIGVVTLTAVQFTTGSIGWSAIIFIYIVLVFWVLSMWWSVTNLAKRTSNRLPKIIRLTDDAVETESDLGKKLSAWATIIEFKKTKDYYFLYFSKASFMPVKLADVKDAGKFEAILNRKIRPLV